MYFIGVSKVSNNVHKRNSPYRRPPLHEVAYYFSESGIINRKKISKIKFYYYKYFKTKWKKRKFICENCSNSFQGLIKNEGDQVDCPNC